MKDALRIVTINTGKCDGPYYPRREAMARQLGALDADVIALQESFASVDGCVTTADYLGAALGMRVEFAPARRKVRMLEGKELLSDSGMAILSRRPLAQATAVNLPFDANDGDRVAQIVVLDLQGRTVVIANVHFCHLAEAAAVRSRQLRAVLDHPWLADERSPTLVLGDFNATCQSKELRPYFAGERDWSVLDAWNAGAGGLSRETVTRRGSWCRDRKADRCIDFILSFRRRDRSHPEFQSSRLVLDTRDEQSGVYPSDHFGVATTLLL